VKFVRETKHLSQEQLGEILGISKGALSRIEQGHRRLDPVAYASKICNLFGCTHTWLYTGVATNEVETNLNLALAGPSSSSSSKPSSRSRSRRSA
jgi:transcriptional regulator with XRE-family HTH domain